MANLGTGLISHLRRLCVEIGPRPAGSEANHTAAAYIRSVFRDSGLDVEVQEYPCPTWEHLETQLGVNGERPEGRRASGADRAVRPL